MRISKIEIEKYRQHESLVLNFPQIKDHDLHLIVAENGVGKTNILNAITWCLYEEEPHLGLPDKNKGLPFVNLTALRKARDEGRSNIEVAVCITAEDNNRSIIFKRTATLNITNDIFEKSNTLVASETYNGETKVFDKETATAIVNKYMPNKIKEYFYFDGEQLNTYFTDNQGSRIYDAIFSISQIDILKRIKDRLTSYLKDQRKVAAKTSSSVEEIDLELRESESLLKTEKENKSKLQSQIALSKTQITEISIFLKGQENFQALEKTRSDKRDLEADYKDKYDHNKKDILNFILKMKIAMSFYRSAKLTYDIINKMQADGNLPPNIDKDFLYSILKKEQCLVCGQQLTANEHLQIKNLIERLTVSSHTSNLLSSIKNELSQIIDDVRAYPERSKELYQEKNEIEKKLKKVRHELQNIENEMSQFSDENIIRQKFKERCDHERLLETNLQKLGICNSMIEKHEKTSEILSKKLNQAISANKSLETLDKQNKLAEESKKTVEAVEVDMMNEIKNQMQGKTAEYFLNLIWKKNTYLPDCITLNDDFQLDLIHPDGFSAIGTASAAERCLLALSFTLALHKVSGFNSLLFIDTPLARTSGINRINFSDILVQSSLDKQLILTLTPAEFSSEVAERFRPIASTYTSVILPDEQSTQIGDPS